MHRGSHTSGNRRTALNALTGVSVPRRRGSDVSPADNHAADEAAGCGEGGGGDATDAVVEG